MVIIFPTKAREQGLLIELIRDHVSLNMTALEELNMTAFEEFPMNATIHPRSSTGFIITPSRPMSPEISREAATRRATEEANVSRNIERAAVSLRAAAAQSRHNNETRL
jgi:hypothetical protein